VLVQGFPASNSKGEATLQEQCARGCGLGDHDRVDTDRGTGHGGCHREGDSASKCTDDRPDKWALPPVVVLSVEVVAHPQRFEPPLLGQFGLLNQLGGGCTPRTTGSSRFAQ
jgi:hypothetical protein